MGAGDLICSLFTAHLVNGQSQLAANAVNHVLDITKQQNARDLAILDAQKWIKQPDLRYRDILLVL